MRISALILFTTSLIGCASPDARRQGCEDSPWLATKRLLDRMQHELRCAGKDLGIPLDHEVIIGPKYIFVRAEYKGRIDTVYFYLSCDGRKHKLEWETANQFTTWSDGPLRPSRCPRP